MSTSDLIKLLMGIIGAVIGTIFLFFHIIKKRRSVGYFSHNNKSETIMGHVRKYWFFMAALMFYCMSFSGFISLALY